MARKKYNKSEKNFTNIGIANYYNSLNKTCHFTLYDNLTEIIDSNQLNLNDKSFADLTFEGFYGNGIRRIGTKAFDKSTETIIYFWCINCELPDSPSNYNIWTTLSQLKQLQLLFIDLNVANIPSNAIKSNDDQRSKLKYLAIKSKQNLTFKSNAFQNLNALEEFGIVITNISKIEKAAFNLNSNNKLLLMFYFVKFVW